MPDGVAEGLRVPGTCRFAPPVHSPIGGSLFPEVMDNTPGCGKHPDIFSEHLAELVIRGAPAVMQMYETIAPALMALGEKLALETLAPGGPDGDRLEPRPEGQ
jgi:hypothetical protein